MLIINNRFLSLYDYNFLLMIEKIWNLEEKYVCKHKVGILFFIYKTDNPKDEEKNPFQRRLNQLYKTPLRNRDDQKEERKGYKLISLYE